MKFIELFAGIGGFRYGLEVWDIYNQRMRKDKGVGTLRPNFTKGSRAGFLIVSGQTSGTNMPPKPTRSIMENVTKETSEQLTLPKSQITIYSVLDSLAKRLALLEKGKDLKTPGGLSFLKSLGLQSTKDPDIYSLKTSKVCLVTNPAKLSRQSLGFSPTWGIELNGRYLIANTSEFPKTGKGCSLSDILEEKVDQKYFLSKHTIKKIIQWQGRAVKTGTGHGVALYEQEDQRVLDREMSLSKLKNLKSDA